MTRRKAPHEKLRPGPKPGSKHAPRAEPAAPPAPPVSAAAPIQVPGDFAARGVRIEDMDEAPLRAYARQIGMVPRDVEHLPLDRLRQNCMLIVQQRIEDEL